MDQRRRVVKLIKTLQPRASNRQIAKTLGVSKNTVRRDTGANAPPGLSGAEVVRLAQRQAAKTESADRAERRLGDYRSVERAATSKATIRRRSRASVRGLIT